MTRLFYLLLAVALWCIRCGEKGCGSTCPCGDECGSRNSCYSNCKVSVNGSS